MRGQQVADNSLTADDVVYSLDDAYDNGGSGLGRSITADSGQVIINAGSTALALEVTGNIRASNKISSLGSLESLQSTGDAGGSLFLSKAVTNTVLTTGVTIDVNQNKLRIFETGGTNRGGYFDLTGFGASAVTDIAGRNIPLSQLGDASDGSATLDGSSTVGWASLSGVVYTMTRDAFLRNLTVNSGITLRLQGFLPYVKGTLTNNGTIETKGNDAVTNTIGAAITSMGSWGLASGGGGGAAGPTTGNGAGNPGAGSGGNSIGGSGGNGGGAGAQSGGGGNSSAAPAAGAGSWRDTSLFIRRRLFVGTTVNTLNSSGGGGGGAVAGDGVNSGTGGAGGSAGPNCYIYCNILDNTSGTIRALGGAGGNATSAGGTTKAGGGGGGSGGGVIVAANVVVGLGTITSTGGSFGTGANGGNNGSAGTAGTILILTGS